MSNFADNSDYITIIIPSIGRETLKNSIQSLLNQTLNKWKAIIVYDGCKNILDLDLLNDRRLSYYEIEKTSGVINQAGDVRNYGMQFVKSKWVGFLDDDDCLGKNYVEYFFKNCELFHFDVFIYRMIQEDLKIFPSLLSKDIIPCDVGISFIMKMELFRKCGLKFENSHCEDYDFLYIVKKKNHLILISHYIQYFIKSCENDFVDKNVLLLNNLNNVVFINGINPNCLINYYNLMK
jgi:glycosyltransferase involved in cell wall biosynthesis